MYTKSLKSIWSTRTALMGCGDWNDGMNKVGFKGKGESVWVGFFLIRYFTKKIHLATQKMTKH